ILLFDSGSGTLGRLIQIGISYRDIDYIFYSHIHPDHVADLVPFLFACKYGDAIREKDLQIVAGKGFNDFFGRLKYVYGEWIEPSSYHLTLKEITDERISYEGFSIIGKPMAHIQESIGYRIESEEGRSIVFSGDTDYCKNIVDMAEDTDLLVLECSFPDEMKVKGHLIPSLAGKIATESHCKKLILTHLYPPCDSIDILGQCKRIFDGEVIIAEDLMKIVVS
ncbi:MAG: MBL fold metallo-hydrolase, partial [Nitrospinae bacterium]|nr:MBL fold metallo-hydrolase [Nitrospinota bacterium]